jgi:UV DNA damage endonuclease
MSVKNIELGYVAQNTALRKEVYTGRTTIRATIQRLGPEKGVQFLKDLALKNISDLETIVDWNHEHGIHFFRVTSTLFSHAGDPYFQTRKGWEGIRYFKGDISFAKPHLERIGRKARRYGQRLDFHSQAFLQLGTPHEEVFERTLFDIKVHYNILKYLGLEGEPGLILHIGGYYEDKIATLHRWLRNYKRLPEKYRKIIMIENDESYYGVRDVLPFCQLNNIPMVFDMFHNLISVEPVPVTTKLMDEICATWDHTKLEPKFHLSDQAPGGRRGKHGLYVKQIPQWFINYCQLHRNRKKTFWVMVEAKRKQEAVFRLLKHHNS